MLHGRGCWSGCEQDRPHSYRFDPPPLVLWAQVKNSYYTRREEIICSSYSCVCVCLVSEIEKALGLEAGDSLDLESDSIKRKVSQRSLRSFFVKISQLNWFHYLCLCGFVSSYQSVTMATSIMTRWSTAMEAALECCDGPNVSRHDCLEINNPVKR